jgi:hypothetical protein
MNPPLKERKMRNPTKWDRRSEASLPLLMVAAFILAVLTGTAIFTGVIDFYLAVAIALVAALGIIGLIYLCVTLGTCAHGTWRSQCPYEECAVPAATPVVTPQPELSVVTPPLVAAPVVLRTTHP